MSAEATGWVDARLLQAAQEWLEEHGDPFDGQNYTTSGNPFLWRAERAFTSALADYRTLHVVPDERVPGYGFWLYRLWNANRRLLYVGVTRNPSARLAAHRRKWGDVIARCTWEECDDARNMLAKEASAIENECPAFNIVHPERVD